MIVSPRYFIRRYYVNYKWHKLNCEKFYFIYVAEKSYGRPLPVSRSHSIQLINSFAQTEVVNPLTDDAMSVSNVDKDMVDSGVVAQLRTSNRTSVTEEDEGAVSITYDDRYRCVSVSEEDDPVDIENRSSQEVRILSCIT